MPLSKEQKQKIHNLLSEKIESKLKKYERETAYMPFLARLIQDNEKIAAYSFIHSLSTTLGMSIYENISVILAEPSSEEAVRDYTVGGVISKPQKTIIAEIVRQLRNKEREADIGRECEEVLAASAEGGEFHKSGSKADFYMKRDGVEHYFEIKTVKPNIDIFEKSKTKLLEWIARRRVPIRVYLAFPYNPYYPEPYHRFTKVGMMDAPHDFLIGDEYWDFIGGENTFPELLTIFNQVGMTYKDRLNEKFTAVVREKRDSY